MSGWFNVNKEGLAKLIERRGKSFILFELVQNCWDTETERVEITLEKIPGKPFVQLKVVDDDPDGFADLAHAYTLFAESVKKGDPTKRGFMNLGEKLVLAICRKASIYSTTGSVHFEEDGTRRRGRVKRESGSAFLAEVRMTTVELAQVCQDATKLIPPDGTVTYFNGQLITPRNRVAHAEASLKTRVADEEGNMRPTHRKTRIDIYEPADGEVAHIYEMGIPVVETGDRYHLDVQQKVPVTLDRTNVPPSYLRTLRALALNATFEQLDEEAAAENWVNDAIAHDDIEEAAVKEVLTKRFGRKRSVYDPSDPESNQQLTSEGYTVIPSRAFSRPAWDNIRAAKAARPSGRIRPTPKPYSQDPNAKPVDLISPGDYTPGQRSIASLVERLGRLLLAVDVTVRLVKGGKCTAAYARLGPSSGEMDINVRRLRGLSFDLRKGQPLARWLDLIVHELAHHFSSSHLNHDYHKACTRLAGKLAVLAIEQPEVLDCDSN